MPHGDGGPTDKERDDYKRAEAIFEGTEPDFSYNPADDKHGMGDYVQITYLMALRSKTTVRVCTCMCRGVPDSCLVEHALPGLFITIPR